MSEDNSKRKELIEAIGRLNPMQVEVLQGIVDKFTEEIEREHLRTDFLDAQAFEYFSTRLAAHHASSGVALKKENFEHILEHSFKMSGHSAQRTENMTHRGADLEVDGRYYSLKTEAAKGLNPKSITISKLMEARWIRDLGSHHNAPKQVQERVLSHLREYERIFMLRSYGDEQSIRYDLVEIPKKVLAMVQSLKSTDFKPLSGSGGTSAKVMVNGRKAFTLRLDGSVEKVTIAGLDVRLCSFHAWWRLSRPG
ncbi:hypothetical protein OZN62_06720 [Aurantiacibacter sp. MUD11]|uniref:hypothetical protein n=1 Tax=Aurantiacibacter sp. MUD11 TaxID=3003265 RepID=UPI0022AAA4AB|nr:hypothetical protein [Aurantiacibacter sp. MUD11]WAT19252.1 hypothetical protein OZN62_06720 [Aurantiacibacter sp. MUD11]